MIYFLKTNTIENIYEIVPHFENMMLSNVSILQAIIICNYCRN